MVQLKYYGDDRDYFKYDLITYLLKSLEIKNYGFVPMLTEHRDDNEGNVTAVDSGCKCKVLLNHIKEPPNP